MRKPAAIALALAVLPGPARADACSDLARLAEHVMRSHQDGVSLQRVLDILATMDDIDLVRRMGRGIAIEAYSEPRYSGAEYRQRAVDDFRDRVHVMCLKAER